MMDGHDWKLKSALRYWQGKNLSAASHANGTEAHMAKTSGPEKKNATQLRGVLSGVPTGIRTPVLTVKG
jgi:hypothetical protein